MRVLGFQLGRLGHVTGSSVLAEGAVLTRTGSVISSETARADRTRPTVGVSNATSSIKAASNKRR